MRSWMPPALAMLLSWSQVSSANVASLVSRADSLYHQALMAEGPDRVVLAQRAAGMLEQAIAEMGRANGYLRYNLGTAYHLAGDLGRAILNYRLAQRLIGGFADLEANLELALAQRRDKIEPGTREEIARALFFWHYVLSPALRRRVFSAGFVLLWILLGVHAVRRAALLPTLAGLCAMVALAFGLSVANDLIAQVKQDHGVVVATEVVARTGPGASYAAAYEGGLHAGTEFRVLEQEGSWYRVRLADGADCWLPEGSFARY